MRSLVQITKAVLCLGFPRLTYKTTPFSFVSLNPICPYAEEVGFIGALFANKFCHLYVFLVFGERHILLPFSLQPVVFFFFFLHLCVLIHHLIQRIQQCNNKVGNRTAL